MNPTCYVFNTRADGFSLYLGGVTTTEGLAQFSPTARCSINHVYMDSDPEVPVGYDRVHTVSAAAEFLTALAPATPVDFLCSIESGTTLSSHDDCECHIRTSTVQEIWRILRAVQPATHATTLRAKLTANPGAYLVCEPNGSITAYPNFDAFLSRP